MIGTNDSSVKTAVKVIVHVKLFVTYRLLLMQEGSTANTTRA